MRYIPQQNTKHAILETLKPQKTGNRGLKIEQRATAGLKIPFGLTYKPIGRYNNAH